MADEQLCRVAWKAWQAYVKTKESADPPCSWTKAEAVVKKFTWIAVKAVREALDADSTLRTEPIRFCRPAAEAE